MSMLSICGTRPEGLLSSSSITPHAPSQCYIDVVLVPLPTWLLIIMLAVILLIHFFFYRRRDNNNTISHSSPRLYGTKRRRALRISYYFSAIAIIGMEALECARLVRANLGVGLVPVVFAGVVIAVVTRAIVDGKSDTQGQLWKRVSWTLAFFWFLSFIFTVVKVATTAQMALKFDMVYARAGSQYPMLDQFTDLVVVALFYLILLVLEILMGRVAGPRTFG